MIEGEPVVRLGIGFLKLEFNSYLVREFQDLTF
jgi:hypothetical protein